MNNLFLIPMAIAGLLVLLIRIKFNQRMKKVKLNDKQKRLYQPLFRTPFGKLLYLLTHKASIQ